MIYIYFFFDHTKVTRRAHSPPDPLQHLPGGAKAPGRPLPWLGQKFLLCEIIRSTIFFSCSVEPIRWTPARTPKQRFWVPNRPKMIFQSQKTLNQCLGLTQLMPRRRCWTFLHVEVGFKPRHKKFAETRFGRFLTFHFFSSKGNFSINF